MAEANQVPGTDLERVVVNDEEQFSLWPIGRELPHGWREEGTRGSRAVCLERIELIWTDMRPKSVRGRGTGDAKASGKHE
jgi:MbtH protein